MVERHIILPALGALLLVLTLASGCTGPASDDRSLEITRLKGYFVVGLDDHFPPLSFRLPSVDRTVRYELNLEKKAVEKITVGDELVGFDIDLAKKAAEKLGLRVIFQPVPWDGIIASLEKGEIDMIWSGLSVTPERRERIIFSRPYLDNRQIVMVKSGAAISGKADLQGKTVGLQLGSSSDTALHAERRIAAHLKALKRYPDDAAAMRELEAGRLDAVVIDEVMGRYLITQKPGVFAVLADDFGREEYAVGFRKNDRALRDAVDRALGEMMRDGAADAVAKKWFGAAIAEK